MLKENNEDYFYISRAKILAFVVCCIGIFISNCYIKDEAINNQSFSYILISIFFYIFLTILIIFTITFINTYFSITAALIINRLRNLVQNLIIHIKSCTRKKLYEKTEKVDLDFVKNALNSKNKCPDITESENLIINFRNNKNLGYNINNFDSNIYETKMIDNYDFNNFDKNKILFKDVGNIKLNVDAGQIKNKLNTDINDNNNQTEIITKTLFTPVKVDNKDLNIQFINQNNKTNNIKLSDFLQKQETNDLKGNNENNDKIKQSIKSNINNNWTSNYNNKANSLNNSSDKIDFVLRKIYERDYMIELKDIRSFYDFNTNCLENQLLKISEEISKPYLIKRLEKYVKNLKSFISVNVLPKLLEKHNSSIYTLNHILNEYNIEVTNDLEICINKFESLQSNIISRIKNMGNSNFSSLKMGNKESLKNKFSGLTTSSISINSSSINNISSNHLTNDYRNERIFIFWGDNFTLKKLVVLLEEKILQLKKGNQFLQENIRNLNINNQEYNDNKSTGLHFLNSNTNVDNIEISNKKLNKLIEEINTRVNINMLLYNENHNYKFNFNEELHIFLDYTIKRIDYFSNTNLEFILYNKGDKYRNYNWCSFFPTDADIIGNLIIKQIEICIIANHLYTKPILIKYPINPISLVDEKNINIKDLKDKSNEEYKPLKNCFVYLINNDIFSTHYNLYYNDKMIDFNPVSYFLFSLMIMYSFVLF